MRFYETTAGKKSPESLTQQVKNRFVVFSTGQPEVEALEFYRQTTVVNAEKVQDSGVEIMDVNGIADDVVTEVVRFTVHEAALDTGPRQPVGEAAGMVIAAIIVRS